MPRLQLNPCPHCQKPLELLKEETFGKEIIQYFKCGHAFGKGKIEIHSETLDYRAIDFSGHELRQYQKEGVQFCLDAIENEGGALLADQMRLGKTPQAEIVIKNYNQWPVLIIVRAANVYQWVRETKKWCNSLPCGVWVIEGTKSFTPPGFSVYIISMDTFGRRGTCKSCKHQFHDEECVRCEKKNSSCRICVPAGDAMSDQLLEFGFKLCVVDEAHSMKNTDAQRTRALVSFLKNIERSSTIETLDFDCPNCHNKWQEQVELKIDSSEETMRVHKTSHCEKCLTQVSISAARHVKIQRECRVLFLTGTPIKNKADEYFVPLNIIAPAKFPSITAFRRRYLIQDSKGAFSRVHPHELENFKRTIAPFVLRREKEDIYKELPKLNRIFSVVTVDDERLKKAYNQVLDTIEGSMSATGNLNFFNSIGELQKLRQICGLAKVGFVADYAETFICDSEKAKLAIGYHHHSVRDALFYKLEQFGVSKLDGQDSPQQKDYIAHKYFEKSDKQILLLGEQACKEGIELVYVENALVTERQWNSADEEQFEFRFFNPDLGYLKSRGLENKVTTVEYVLAKGTIDQFFHEMVEEKRAIFGETIANNWSMDQDQTSFKELMERTVASRL